MKIKIDHINLTVTDIKTSIQWYENLFGFRPVEHGFNQLGKPWVIVANDDSMIVMSEYNNRRPDDPSEDKSIHKIYHFGIRVSDQTEWLNRIEKHGLKIKYGGIVDYPHSKSWYVHDPSGHEIEVSYAGNKPLLFP